MKVGEKLTDDELIQLEKKILDNYGSETLSFKDYYFHKSTKELKDNVWDIIKSAETYTTINQKGEIQCHANKNRSLGDIFKLVKYYYPEVTLKDVRQGLYNLINEHRICSLQCPAIHKRVYYTQLNKHGCCSEENNIIGLDDRDEYGNYLKVIR